MQFVHPSFLWFLLAAGIPVLIHLFRLQRYKREYFSNVRLLQEIQTEQKRSARWREYLVLAARILTIVALVLAFAQPYVPYVSGQVAVSGQTWVSIYLDNSFSMQAPSREAILLEKAKEQVRKILQSFPPDAAVQLLTNEFRGEDQNFRTPAEAAELLSGMGFSPVSRSIEEVRLRQEEAFRESAVAVQYRLYYYVSDFQKSTFSLPEGGIWGDTQSRYVFVPVSGVDYANISLDSIRLDTPVLQAGQEIGLRAFLKNRSDKEQLQVPLRLFVEGKQAGVYPVDFQIGETVEVYMPVRFEKSGFYQGYAEIADYPVEFDNRMYFSLAIAPRLSVLHLYDRMASSPVARLFGNDSAFSYTPVSVRHLDYRELRNARLIVADMLDEWPSALTAELAAFVRGGGSLLLVPSVPVTGDSAYMAASSLVRELTGGSYAAFRPEAASVKRIDTEHPVFSLALASVSGSEIHPRVSGYYPLPVSGKVPYTGLMGLSLSPGRGEADFLGVYSVGKGLLYLLATPLDEAFTDFSKHYTFVVALLNMAFYQGGDRVLYYKTGSSQGLYFPSALFTGDPEDAVYAVVADGSAFELIPPVRRIGSETAFFPYGEIAEAGNYNLLLSNGRKQGVQDFLAEQTMAGSLRRAPLSFNYDRAESEKECYGEADLREWTGGPGDRHHFVLDPDRKDLSRSVEQLNRGREFWKLFLIFALAFALLETLFLRGWIRKRPSAGNTKRSS